MPLTKSVADVFGVATIGLVAILILLGLLCIVYSFYFRSRIQRQGLIQLNYFSGPWIVRIIFILFAIWWGIGEIIRLNLLRQEGRILNSLNVRWQETVCKCYIVSNMGFAEPCLFLTLIFLLRAPLQKMESGTLSGKWNIKTASHVLLYCFPVFVLQLIVILIGPNIDKDRTSLPHYFTRTAVPSTTGNGSNVAFCTYPLLSTILLGLFVTVLTMYLFWFGRRILAMVINKGLQKRVYTMVLSISGFLPLRVLLLGLSVLSNPEDVLFEALSFLAFLAHLCCAGVCICMLVYCPVADSLALGSLEARRRRNDDYNDTISLITNQSLLGESSGNSPGRNSDGSTKRGGSISFRATEKGGTSTEAYVELSLFSPSCNVSPPGSPQLVGWSMRSALPAQELGP